jgi:hypothetical protein
MFFIVNPPFGCQTRWAERRNRERPELHDEKAATRTALRAGP